jgi:hypothetical protein
MTALRDPQPGLPLRDVRSNRSSSAAPPASAANSADSKRLSRPPPSSDVSAPFETGFVAKIEPPAFEERSLARRLRTASALLVAAILVAILDPIYAAVVGEVLEIVGLRLSALAAALLLLALGLAVREVTRETMAKP